MTLKEYVLKWDNAWRYDYWWRQKYQIPFNSVRHRQANQLDIAFEYFENHMSLKVADKLREEEENKKLLAEGTIVKDNGDPDKEKKLFDKMDVTSW